MFGTNIYDNELKGIIPRAAVDIFQIWESNPEAKEVVILCSMLEIYKENLRDLLADVVVDLKIKESPSNGIYVEGLCQIPIGSPEELMYYIDIGETRRVWAETRHNSVSSRSHTIFVLEVRQTLGNGSEKRGILNLVDLAGSEKVGKSGAQGETFEEGTKINLSLSALGNVIHALTSNLEHIPYRDSKLTRLLQESLGGNYKTSLIVACSPHSSQMNETITTLQFAQRAKKLKNKVQMNFKKAPEDLLKLIEQLQQELKRKNDEIQKMRNSIYYEKKEKDLSKTQVKTELEDEIPMSEYNNITTELANPSPAQNTSGPETKIPFWKSFHKVKLHSDASEDYDFNKSEQNDAKEQENISLKEKITGLNAIIETQRKEKGDLNEKIKKLEINLIDERKRVIEAEKQVAELEEIIQESNLQKSKVKMQEEYENLQIKILTNQLNALTEALEDSEAECFKLLKEKKDKLEKETVETCNLKLTDFLNQDNLHPSVTIIHIKIILAISKVGKLFGFSRFRSFRFFHCT